MGFISQAFNKYKSLSIILMLIVISAGIFPRLYGIGNQMTTADDIGVAWTIGQASQGYSSDFVRNKIYNPAHPDNQSLQYRLLRKLDAGGIIGAVMPCLNAVTRFIVIPQAWTYAPLQFIFTPLFLLLAQDYSSTIFGGRLPSLIVSILALLIMVLIYCRLEKKNFLVLAVAGLLPLLFSWENILYSRHMSSYAIGVFGVTLLFYVILTVVEKERLSVKKSILLGLGLAVITNMQYQLIFFIPALYLVWFVCGVERIRFSKEAVISFIKSPGFRAPLISLLAFFIFILPTFFLFILPQSNANSRGIQGISDSFYYQAQFGSSFIEAISYPFVFFGENFFKIVKFVTAFMPHRGILIDCISAIFIALSLIGLISWSLSKSPARRSLGLFVLFSFITVAVLVLAGKIAFSPTRHALVYLPFMALMISAGVEYIFGFLQKKIPFDIKYPVFFVLAVPVIVLFFMNWQAIMSVRQDVYSRTKLQEIVDEFRPQYAVTPSYSLWSSEFFGGWKLTDYKDDSYVNLYEAKKDFISGTYLLIYQSDFPNNICEDKYAGRPLAQAVCVSPSTTINIGSGSSFDISDETKAVRNSLQVRVITAGAGN